MDTIFIEDLRIDAIIGIYDWERVVPQTLVLNVALANDIRVAARTEDIAKAINYAEVARSLEQRICSEKYRLVETLVEDCAAMLMREFGTPWVKVRCKKIQVMPQAGGVGIEIERGKRPVREV